MPFGNQVKVSFYLAWKKVITVRVHFFLVLGFVALLAVIWLNDSYDLALRFFLVFYPHLFLFLSQDMVRDEVESGCLENIIFINKKYQIYFGQKNLFLFALAGLISALLFVFLIIFGVTANRFMPGQLLQFSIGLLVGLYYVALGGLLSFFVRGGANVLIVILGQVAASIGLLFSATQATGFVGFLDKGSFPDLASRLKFMALVALFPNIVTAKKFFIYSAEVAALAVLLFSWQVKKIRALELRKT